MDIRDLRLLRVEDLGGPTWMAAGDLLLTTPQAPPLAEIAAALRAGWLAGDTHSGSGEEGLVS